MFPRGVSVNGRIVLGVPAAASAVTPLAPHSFHGGPGPGPLPAQHSCREPLGEHDSAWWNLDPVRLEADQAAVRSAFPSFQLNRDDGDYRWQGVL